MIGLGDSVGKPNIILLVIDTLRYDYAMSSPFFKALSEKGMFFERMYSPSTFTNAIMSSVRSGMYPPRHGWRSWPDSYPLGENIKTIEDFLDEAGYSSNRISLPIKPGETQKIMERKRALKAMTRQEPFFLYSHYIDIHNEFFFDKMEYGGLIPAAGDFVETAFKYVKNLNFKNDILWIIMSDHGIGLEGDSLVKEGEDVGAGQVYDFRTRAYCVLIGSDIEPVVMTGAYSHVDLLPSILDYCDIQPTIPDGFLEMQGVSVFEEQKPDRYVYLEAQSPSSIWPSEQPNVFGATNGILKLMETPDGNKCYNLIVDPEEKNDLLIPLDLKPLLNFIKEIK